jgi:CubicO group peptidase (beta-lactamase class C family)
MTQLEQLQRLLDSLVAAGAPGAAAWVQDEDESLQAASGVADISTGRPMEARLRFRDWSPQALVALVAGRPPSFPPGTAWSYSNTGYILLGLLVETAGGATLAQELQRRIVEPLGLRHTYLPGNARELPGPRSHGYSLRVGPGGEVLDGPLLDFTVQNPSWAWAAGALVSDLEDLVGFFRALLGGRLLPPGLLAEMRTTVPVPPGSIPPPPVRPLRAGAAGGRDARWPPGRPTRWDPRLSQHGPEHPGRPPAARRHDQPADRPGPRL